MKSPQQERSRRSTERMLLSALAVIDEGGVESLTVDHVARASATSNGSIYHRYGSRDGLVAAAIDFFFAEIETSMQRALRAADGESDDLAAMSAVVTTWLTLFTKYRQRFRAFMIEAGTTTVHSSRGRQASHAIADGFSTWAIGRFDCEKSAADSCYAVLMGLGTSTALFEPSDILPAPLPPSEFAGQIAAMLLAAVAK